MITERFPKTWYEWVLLSLAGYIFLMQSISATLIGLNSMFFMIQSPLIPTYAAYVTALAELPLALAGLSGLAGIILCIIQKKSGWALLMTAVVFFTFLHGYFTVQELINHILPIDLIYLLFLICLLGLLLRKTTRLAFQVRSLHFIFVVLLNLLLISAFADAYNIVLFFL